MHFHRIALMSRQQTNKATIDTLLAIYDFLIQHKFEVLIDEHTAHLLPDPLKRPILLRKDLATHCDLMIVVGGDGSLLEAARLVAPFNVPVLGVNRGQLGFLTDILPSEVTSKIGAILRGNYIEEPRFLLRGVIHRKGEPQEPSQLALNDIAVYSGHLSRLIEFEVFINDQFVYRQRSDGLIIATPTGSTAYALSGGGPIIYPSLEAMVLVPMMPHTLSSRPIVINSASVVDIKIPNDLNRQPDVSFDGQGIRQLNPGDYIRVDRSAHLLRLIHPSDHDYYLTLRTKLQWGSQLPSG